MRLGVCVLASLVVLLSGAPVQAAESPTPLQDEMAVLVARARVAAGLLPLARDRALDKAAQAHAEDMAAQGYMEHEGLDGSTPASRAFESGYETPEGSAWIVVEVISARGDPPQDALDWWLSDGLHRRVVLRSTWRDIGIGFAKGGPYGRFWVMLFGCRPNVLTPVLLDGTLNIPDENCGSGGDAFGHVADVRVATSAAAMERAEWEAYGSERPWPAGEAAVVQMRDGAGRVIQALASDLSAGAALAEAP